MSQEELIDYIISLFPNLGIDDAKNMIQIVFMTIQNVLLLGESVNLPSIGKIYPEFTDSGDIKLKFKVFKSFETTLTEKLIDRYNGFINEVEKRKEEKVR